MALGTRSYVNRSWMFMYAIIWFYIIIMTTFWRSFLIRWIGTKTIKNQWCDALTWDLGGIHLFKQLAISCTITWFISSFRSNCCQTWANSQNDNYFHSKWSKIVTLSENRCHFVNLLSFDNSYVLLSYRWITWSNSQLKSAGTHVDH